MSLAPGARLGPYEILSTLGRGGMGEVYRAVHEKLGREVAIKVLPAEVASDRQRLSRFEREARAASSLNHPNVVTIHDIAEHNGIVYIAMELVAGRTLRQLLAHGPLPASQTIALGRQIADGLAKAHAAGIVHRDLKPDNVMVTDDGLVKILDFGLAKSTEPNPPSGQTTLEKDTETGVLVGTPHYMSPEHASGKPLDPRSDQFSFGIVLYELLGGQRPFEGPSSISIISAILHEAPRPLKLLRPDTPKDLDRLVQRCLEKDPDRRYESASEISRELSLCEEHLSRQGRALILRTPAVAAALVLIVAAAAVAAWMWTRHSGKRWAELEALPQMASLVDRGDLFGAYRLALEAQKHIPENVELEKTLARITMPLAIVTEPPGAEVSIKGYSTPDDEWHVLGVTPLKMRLPYTLMRWRIRKEGYETFEGAPFSGPTIMMLAQGLRLEKAGTRPSGSVHVPGGAFRPMAGIRRGGKLRHGPMAAYWIDRYEVTNRQFKEFVDRGGYRNRDLWTEPFVREGRAMAWEEAMSVFRDETGRPGPASWKFGTFVEGGDDLPISGVSWYEAAAYCKFAGKSLPTIYHWFQAIGQEQLSDMVKFSNFASDGPAPVGKLRGLGGFGTYDMAGNVKEWCWNATGDKRYALGGSWNEPSYVFKHLVAQQAFERSPTCGFRCATYGEQVDTALLDPVDPTTEVMERKPVPDEVFQAYLDMYAYDKNELAPVIEKVDDSSPYWRRETVSFNAAYGNERVQTLIFLPRNAKPPYQVVAWYPGDDAFMLQSSETLASPFVFDFIPRSGRAFVYPIYKGMYERCMPFKRTGNEWRDMVVLWSKDLSRTVDYLATRKDIDSDKLGYYGFSAGANYGPIFTTVDARFKASVLLGGGLVPLELRPEMNHANFASRCRVPTVMINGRDDFLLPYESSQKPLFDLLGAPESDKRHARLEGGHVPSSRLEMVREVLAWYDRHLGAVEQ